MATVKLTAENFVEEALGSATPVIIDFYADWCGPCRMLAPTLEKIARERRDVKVCKVNVDESPELAQTFEIEVIPTLVAMRDGGVIAKRTGVMPEESILGMLGM